MTLESFVVLADTPLDRLVQPDVVWILIPVIAIVMAFTSGMLKAWIRHRERMAKIGMGIDPDLDQTNPGSRPGAPLRNP
jgi:hypothetical protein